MPASSSNTPVFISQSQSGFPPYLDFSKMRSEAIEHLGPITSAYWTDYNEHDPGITTIESLLYALVDLGYRVNWPIVDLLTQKNGEAETDFLTPAQVLGSNPFTINDYRKRLMDLKEVRNAWLQPAADKTPDGTVINGIYQVLLELEEGAADFESTQEWEKYRNAVLAAVNKVLRAHRNLCEDFGDEVVIMGKDPYIVTADIELTAGATIAEVYEALIGQLYTYFSPVPNYCTLAQLIAQGISPAQIFGGRPYEHRPSYGFILDSELPALTVAGTRVIYSSRVYNKLLQVQGIASVKNLVVQQAVGSGGAAPMATGVQVWALPLSSHTLPMLSVAGSSFRWFLNGQQLSWNPGSNAKDLQRSLAYSGKILYPWGSPALDNAVPSGQYLAGLGTYYSIQKDFPEVYGIGPGGLPASASVKRQAQAMQFKGYLLFFEQLMADLLARLASVRSLLSMGAQGGAADAGDDEDDDPEDKTGWGPGIDPAGPGVSGAGGLFATPPGDLSDVPGLDMLLQFPVTNTTTDAGVTLAFPVAAHAWNELVRKGSVTCSAVEKLQPYLFPTSHERDLAVAELLLSFAEMPPVPGTVSLEGGKKQVFFIAGIRPDFVLLSKSLFDTGAAALASANAALFAGTSKDYYTSVVLTEAGKVGYSFNLGQSATSYTDYVSQLLTDPQQSVQDRTNYLLHLINRFGESYTDYARLSAGFLSDETIEDNEVGLMQNFLSNLPLLAANRFKGYNYSRRAWDSTNVSGLELRFKAYCGIEDWRRHYLCPFEVSLAERQFRLQAMLGGEAVMTSAASFTGERGYKAAADLYDRMKSAASYRLVKRGTDYFFVVDLGSGAVAESSAAWPDETRAAAAVEQLVRMLRVNPGPEDIRPHQVEWRAEVVNAEGAVVRTSRASYPEEPPAFEEAGKKIHDLKDEKYWHIAPGTENELGKLERSRPSDPHSYLETRGLSIAVKHDILHKPEHCRYVVTEETLHFTFTGVEHYPTASAGRAASHAFPFLLTDTKNYLVQADKETGRHRIAVLSEDKVTAIEATRFDSEASALQAIEHIARSIRRRLYMLRIAPAPLSWKFLFYLGLPVKRGYLFSSSKSFPTEQKAREAAEDFYRANTGWELTKDKKGFQVEKSGGNRKAVTCSLELQEGLSVGDELENELQELVVAKSEVLALEQGNRETLGSWLRPDERFPESGYVYRLVDKDRPRAFHPMSQGNEDDQGRKAAEAARSGLITRGQNGYVYPEFCLGGDNVFAKLDIGGSMVYHYAIRCRNDYFYRLGLEGRDKEWMLFVSIAGYATEDAAQQAFQDNYLYILEKAMEQLNYGEKDFIAWDEHGRRLAVVYVPEDIRLALERAGLNVAGELVKAARAYPIRLTGWEKRRAADAERRAAGFLPVTVTMEEKKNRKPRYFFQLAVAGSGERDWTSAGRFASAQDAHTAFDYFRLLLQEPRNYFVDYDDDSCGYRVGIREVLAESTGSFANEEEAWGEGGVQQFIGAAQQTGGWHPEKQGGSYWGYFIACPDKKALHPCTYESERQRDEVLDRLYAAAQGFPQGGWMTQEGNTIWLSDPIDGHPLAVFAAPATLGAAAAPAAPDYGAIGAGLNIVLDMLDGVWAGLFFEDSDGLYVKANGGQTLVRPADAGISRDRWEDELLRYGAYLPLVRTTIIGAAAQYELEIKLPGFAALPGKEYTDRACGCPPEKPGEAPACYAAWVSKTVYGSATEVWGAYQALLPLLVDKDKYRPVHDEAALEYGIELLTQEQLLARSVQPYFYAKMAARAMDRAKDCVNAEGLNVVEHVLLRPQKGAGKNIPVCAAGDNPSLAISATATVGQSYQPGADAYSFVMTVFLPAWPQRFRKVENRQLLESIVQREAPAHVLPRILWLTPRDMCRMETSYKKWLHWLIEDKSCGSFRPDDLTQLLFNTPFDCMWNVGCGQDSDNKENGDEWLSQINKLYCWSDSDCADTSAWKPGAGSAGGDTSKPFVMSGTKLPRPTLVRTIAEEKPVPPPPPPRRPRQSYTKPTKQSEKSTDTLTQHETFRRRVETALKTGWKQLEAWSAKLAKWGSALLQRRLQRRRNK